MGVVHVEVLVEEPSMERALQTLLPVMLSGATFKIHSYQSKGDLLKTLPSRLRGYCRWLPDGWRIVVLLDRDDDDCEALKRRMESIASRAGLRSRSAARGGPYKLVNRLAIEELEAWFFGDWEAIRSAYPRVPETTPKRAGFRDPDAIAGGTWEALERILKRAGYFKTGLRKIEAAGNIAERMVPARNRSRSFQVLRETLDEMTTA